MPLLEARGLRGTFYVPVAARSFAGRLDEWRQAAARGHELGNHTVFHPAWGHKSYVTEGNDITTYTQDRMRLELEAASRILQGLDGRIDRSFAYPCCNRIIGRPGLVKRCLRRLRLDRTRLMGVADRLAWLDPGSSESSYESLAAELFVAARVGGERFSVQGGFPPPRAAVPCVTLDGKSACEVTTVLDEFLVQDGGWLVFMAHGIGGGHRLSCEQRVFEDLLDSLRSRALPVLTLRDAAEAIY